MGDERTLYESETRRTLPEVIAFLQELTHWLSDGRLAFDEGGQTTFITIPHEVMLEIEVEEEDHGEQVKRSLEIELEWLVDRETAAGRLAADEEE